MRRRNSSRLGLSMAVALYGFSAVASAALSPDEVARLGQDLTCIGAIKAGNEDGTIPEYSGKWTGVPDGIDFKGTGYHPQDPYADEKPLFVITAANMSEYAERLSAGQKKLFEKYPDTFKMPIYPSHRDFSYSQSVCDATLENAKIAKMLSDGEGVDGRPGGVFFPIPKDADEIRLNATLGARYPWTEQAIYDNANVLSNGKISWGRVESMSLAPGNEPGKVLNTSTTKNSSHYMNKTLLPLRDSGEVLTGENAWNYAETPLQSWRYDPGTRRVRLSPGYGYDMTYPGTGGAMTVDEVRIFSNSGHRYEWNIVGKKEIYVPYNNYKIHSNKLKYDDMLTTGHVAPDVMRYELHRVWVIRGELKSGYRHLYKTRDLYIDEDTWFALMGDNYDNNGELWRTSMLNYIHLPELQGWLAGAGLYHDLLSGDYLAFNLINEQPKGHTVNKGNFTPNDFGPDAARRAGR